MRSTLCAICATNEYDALLYEANFTREHLTSATFSARRLPDRIRYRMVRCTRCGLVRADPILEPQELERLYEGSTITYAADKPSLIATYRRYLRRAIRFGNAKGSLLEIGCGDGFFLAEAKQMGLNEVKGVEPGKEAIAAADPEIKPHIVQGLYQSEHFRASTFDYVCLFQVIDHMDDPARCLDILHQHLKPRGILLIISHNWSALTNRVLGEHSPIIDIEHPFLFSTKTITTLLSLHHFRVLGLGAVWNTHALRHWAELAPLPLPLKHRALKLLTLLHINEIKVTIPAGNFYVIAQRIE